MALLTVGQLVRAMGHFSSFSRLASAKRGHLFQPIQNGLTHEHAAVASRTNWLCISLPKSCMIGRHVSRLFQECSIRDASPFETTILFHTELSDAARSFGWVRAQSHISHTWRSAVFGSVTAETVCVQGFG